MTSPPTSAAERRAPTERHVRVKRFTLCLGALSDPIEEQLKAQRLKVPKGTARAFQDIADSITHLRIFHYLSDAQARRLENKFIIRVQDVLRARGKL